MVTLESSRLYFVEWVQCHSTGVHTWIIPGFCCGHGRGEGGLRSTETPVIKPAAARHGLPYPRACLAKEALGLALLEYPWNQASVDNQEGFRSRALGGVG